MTSRSRRSRRPSCQREEGRAGLECGGGIDTLTGDAGADDFVYTAFDGSTDVVTDYSFAEGDEVSGDHYSFDGTDTHVFDASNNELFTLTNYDADTDGIAFL